MKKLFFVLAISAFFINTFAITVQANQPQTVVSVEVPTSSVSTAKTVKKEQSKTSKVLLYLYNISPFSLIK